MALVMWMSAREIPLTSFYVTAGSLQGKARYHDEAESLFRGASKSIFLKHSYSSAYRQVPYCSVADASRFNITGESWIRTLDGGIRLCCEIG